MTTGGQGSGVPDHGQERHAAISRGEAVPTTTPRPISNHSFHPKRCAGTVRPCACVGIVLASPIAASSRRSTSSGSSRNQRSLPSLNVTKLPPSVARSSQRMVPTKIVQATLSSSVSVIVFVDVRRGEFAPGSVVSRELVGITRPPIRRGCWLCSQSRACRTRR